MAGINKAIIVGNLGKDPEIRYTQSLKTVANISVATSRSWKDKATNEWQEATEWHRVVAWDYLAEKAEKLRKGQQVYVEGEIQTRKWTDANGNDKYTTEINAKVLFPTGPKGEARPAGVGDSGHFEPPELPDEGDDDDELPF